MRSCATASARGSTDGARSSPPPVQGGDQAIALLVSERGADRDVDRGAGVANACRDSDWRDTDHDGLDDNWELAKFGTLAYGPLDDPDGDGFNNAREQAIGSNPNDLNSPFPLALDASPWNAQLLRVSWPAAVGRSFELRMSSTANGALSTLTNATGRFPDAEVFVPYNTPARFFRLRAP